MQNDTILLEVKNLNKTFPVKKEKLYAVSDVSFSLKKGECLGIVGESGCGKSTVARMIAGIIPVSGGAPVHLVFALFMAVVVRCVLIFRWFSRIL